MARDPRQGGPRGTKARAMEPTRPDDKRTALQVYREEQQEFYGKKLLQKTLIKQ
jgi:hypothetical protein